MSEGDRERAFRAFRLLKFGDEVTQELRREFFGWLVPAISRLAVDQYDLGCFSDARYVHEIAVDNLVPIQQPACRLGVEQEAYLRGVWMPEQQAKGLVVKAGPYEQCPIVTQLLLIPGVQSGQPFRVVQNLVPLNKRTKVMRMPCRDVRGCRKTLGRSKYLS